MRGSTVKAGSVVGGFAVIAATVAALWYVTAPPKGVDGYRERAAATAETLVSQVETARLWAESEEEGRARLVGNSDSRFVTADRIVDWGPERLQIRGG